MSERNEERRRDEARIAALRQRVAEAERECDETHALAGGLHRQKIAAEAQRDALAGVWSEAQARAGALLRSRSDEEVLDLLRWLRDAPLASTPKPAPDGRQVTGSCPECERWADACAAKDAALRRSTALLRNIEWARTDEYGYVRCFFCTGYNSGNPPNGLGHAEDCALAAHLSATPDAERYCACHPSVHHSVGTVDGGTRCEHCWRPIKADAERERRHNGITLTPDECATIYSAYASGALDDSGLTDEAKAEFATLMGRMMDAAAGFEDGDERARRRDAVVSASLAAHADPSIQAEERRLRSVRKLAALDGGSDA